MRKKISEKLEKIGKRNSNKGMNSVVAASAGAVIGAGVAVAATAALKNEKTRKMINETIDKVREQAAERIPTIRKQIKADEILDVATKRLKSAASTKSTTKHKRSGAKKRMPVAVAR